MNKGIFAICISLIGCLPPNLDNFQEQKDATVDNEVPDVVSEPDVYDASIDVINDVSLDVSDVLDVLAPIIVDHCIVPNSSYTERFSVGGDCEPVQNGIIIVNKDGTLPSQSSCKVSVDGCYISLTNCYDAGSSWHATFTENGNSATGSETYNNCVYNFTLERND
jgi:hypothetical protein